MHAGKIECREKPPRRERSTASRTRAGTIHYTTALTITIYMLIKINNQKSHSKYIFWSQNNN